MKPKQARTQCPLPSQQAAPGQMVPRLLERLLCELAAIAQGRGSEATLVQAADFEHWDGDDSSYLEAHFPSNGLPEIDLNASDGQVVIRITWNS